MTLPLVLSLYSLPTRLCDDARVRSSIQRKFRAATKFQSACRVFLQRQRIVPIVERARIVKEVQWAKDSRQAFRIQKQWRSLRWGAHASRCVRSVCSVCSVCSVFNVRSVCSVCSVCNVCLQCYSPVLSYLVCSDC